MFDTTKVTINHESDFVFVAEIKDHKCYYSFCMN